MGIRMEIATVQRHPDPVHHPLAPLVSTQCGGSKRCAGLLRSKPGYQQVGCRRCDSFSPKFRVQSPAKLDCTIDELTRLCVYPASGVVVTTHLDDEVSKGLVKC